MFGDITSLVNNGLLKVTAFPTTTVDTIVNVTAEPTTREEICVRKESSLVTDCDDLILIDYACKNKICLLNMTENLELK